MKKINIVFLILSGVFVFMACNNRDENGSTDTSNTNSSKSVTDSTRGDKPSLISEIKSEFGGNQSEEFVTKAASGGMLEIQLGQLAQQNAQSERVKNFGRMMVTDHSKANEELKSIAASKNISVPGSLSPHHQKHLDMMKKMSGVEFDKHYMDMMVNDHKEDIDEFKKETGGSNNNPFKTFAAKALPFLQRHLDSAQAIHNK